ncbi:MAG TPA: zinc ribbon domain-containing protein [Burkholderiaceae bacterium]|nr:zinc ribbon domain-containing protein [Burkholderiaceae bacterium]
MPTYAYRCDSCGLAKDEWLKVSEAHAERACPSCGKSTYRKQVTAPAFQLKGSGWYVTDFRNGSSKPAAKKDEGASEAASGANSSDASCGTCGAAEPCAPASASDATSKPTPQAA